MNNEYFIYKTRPGDLLTDLAKKFNISPEDLKNFHNNMPISKIDIHFNNLLGIDEIFIPINYKTPEQKEQELFAERPAKQINSTFYKENYKVKEAITIENKETIEIDYTIGLIFTEEDNKPCVSITRNDVRKKGEELSYKMQELSLWTFQSLFPISFLLNDKGFPTSINHYKLLKENFKTKRAKIEEFYKSELVNIYLELFEEKLFNKNYIGNRLFSFSLFQALFPRIEWFKKIKPFTAYFSILPNTNPILFSCEAIYDHEIKDVVYTIVKGKSIEQKSLKDVINAEGEEINAEITDYVQAEITLVYVTDKISKELQKCKLNITTLDNNDIYSIYDVTIE